MKSLKHVKVQIDQGFYVMMALWLLLMPFSWLCSSILAAVIHELGHIIALDHERVRIDCIRIRGTGATIETEPMTSRQTLICALAGPGAGLLLCMLWKWFPHLSIFAAAQTIFNLIPITPLDGGTALNAIREINREKTEK